MPREPGRYIHARPNRLAENGDDFDAVVIGSKGRSPAFGLAPSHDDRTVAMIVDQFRRRIVSVDTRYIRLASIASASSNNLPL